MSDQVTNENAATEHAQVGLVKVAPPFSTLSSDGLLRRIAILLFILVAGLLTVFAYYCHLSNMLVLTPRPTPRWVRYGETIVGRAIPYLGGRPGMKSGGSA